MIQNVTSQAKKVFYFWENNIDSILRTENDNLNAVTVMGLGDLNPALVNIMEFSMVKVMDTKLDKMSVSIAQLDPQNTLYGLAKSLQVVQMQKINSFIDKGTSSDQILSSDSLRAAGMMKWFINDTDLDVGLKHILVTFDPKTEELDSYALVTQFNNYQLTQDGFSNTAVSYRPTLAIDIDHVREQFDMAKVAVKVMTGTSIANFLSDQVVVTPYNLNEDQDMRALLQIQKLHFNAMSDLLSTSRTLTMQDTILPTAQIKEMIFIFQKSSEKSIDLLVGFPTTTTANIGYGLVTHGDLTDPAHVFTDTLSLQDYYSNFTSLTQDQERHAAIQKDILAKIDSLLN